MTKYRVLIDAERLRQPHSGLGQVALNIGHEFLANPSSVWRPVFLLPENRSSIYGQPVEQEIPSWRRRYLRRLAPRYDLWHILHQDASYLPGRSTPYLLTIHDLNFLGEKSAAKAQARLTKVQRLVDGADMVTVISGFTKTMVEQHLDLGSTPIEVIYNGLCIDPRAIAEAPEGLPEGDFLFTLGVVRKKKNFHVLPDLMQKLDNLNLIIAGNTKGAYADQIKEYCRQLGLEKRVIMLGEVNEQQKTWLFQNCTAFLFPSLFEGFGLPLIEAMSMGKPTFCAKRSSLPEIGGPDVFYWDNFAPDYMATVYREGMQKFSQDDNQAVRLKSRAAEFTWSKAAKQYGKLYERILCKKPIS